MPSRPGRTDLHVVDGDLTDPELVVILGHEVVGVVERVGECADRFTVGQRVGVPWLVWTWGVPLLALGLRGRGAAVRIPDSMT